MPPRPRSRPLATRGKQPRQSSGPATAVGSAGIFRRGEAFLPHAAGQGKSLQHPFEEETHAVGPRVAVIFVEGLHDPCRFAGAGIFAKGAEAFLPHAAGCGTALVLARFAVRARARATLARNAASVGFIEAVAVVGFIEALAVDREGVGGPRRRVDALVPGLL